MRKLTDEEVHQIIGNILRIAVVVAAVIVFIGGILYLIQNGSNSPEYHVSKASPVYVYHRVLKELVSMASELQLTSFDRPRGALFFCLCIYYNAIAFVVKL
jgi:uncharacterized membrane protein